MLTLLFVSWSAPAAAIDWVGTDFLGDDLLLTNGDTLAGTFTNVGRVEVPMTATVFVVSSQLTIEAESFVLDGTLDASGVGGRGGLPGLDGLGPSPGAGGDVGGTASGGGNGGAGGDGGHAQLGGGVTGDDAVTVLLEGSGGGGAMAAGGAGGGAVSLAAAGSLALGANGAILADGRAAPEGYCGAYSLGAGSGGGSGGTIRLDAPTLDLAGLLSVNGGDGGVGCPFWSYIGGGGGGGGGRVSLTGTPLAEPVIRRMGGLGGFASDDAEVGGDGGYGTFYETMIDVDLDGIDDRADNCPDVYNALQEDDDEDGIGNLCEIEDPGDAPVAAEPAEDAPAPAPDEAEPQSGAESPGGCAVAPVTAGPLAVWIALAGLAGYTKKRSHT